MNYYFIALSDDALSVGGRVFLFDHVFKENVSQEAVYNKAALPIVKVGMKEVPKMKSRERLGKITSNNQYRANHLTLVFPLRMCCPDITARYLLTVKPPPVKRTRWREFTETPPSAELRLVSSTIFSTIFTGASTKYGSF